MHTPASSSARVEHTFKEGRDFADCDPSIPVGTFGHDPTPTFVILSFASDPDSFYCLPLFTVTASFDQDFCVCAIGLPYWPDCLLPDCAL